MSELTRGDKVAWSVRNTQQAMIGISAVHRFFENGKTFCSLDVPPAERLFPALPSLNVCSRCHRMAERDNEPGRYVQRDVA